MLVICRSGHTSSSQYESVAPYGTLHSESRSKAKLATGQAEKHAPYEKFILQFYNSLFSVGDLTQWSHLFPFRTEKLSTVVAMILFMGKVASRQHQAMNFFVRG